MPSRPVILKNQHWYSCDTLPWHLPDNWKSWLLDTGSLTARLKKTYSGSFDVSVLFQDWGRPTHDERQFLSIDDREQASIREVLLICSGQPRVFARSILPASSLEGKNRQLLHLKDRPLGAFIFAQPDLKRGPIEITQVRGENGQLIWGRRSLFTLDDKPLAVCEYFLPETISEAIPSHL